MTVRACLSHYLMVLTLLWLSPAVAAQAGEPLELVRVAADRAIEILKDPKLKENKRERLDQLREVAHPIFDFEEMAKRSLGSHWRRRTPAEQQEFVQVFRIFLEKTYSDKIDLYNGEKVSFGREMIDKDFAQVESTLINAKGEEVSVIYRFRRTDGKWKVYDAVIENISIVNNYRSQFDRVISTSSYEELVKRLKDKAG